MGDEVRNPESIEDREFREAMEVLPEDSRVLEIVVEWVEHDEISTEDVDWLLEIAAQKGLCRLRKPTLELHTEFYFPEEVDEVESVAAYEFLQYLRDHLYRQTESGAVFRLGICKYCERPFRLGQRGKEFCCGAHRAAHSRRSK